MYAMAVNCSVGSNGTIKKKKKNKLSQKLSSNQELKEAVIAASDVAKIPESPKKMKKKNKKKNDSLKSSDQPLEASAAVKNNGVQKDLKNGSASVPGSKKTEAMDKKKKKRTKSGQAKAGLPTTPESDEERERRTIFVGNVSTKTTRKSLTRFFSKYGKVMVSEQE